MPTIIGREKETALLQQILQSKEAELVALYGRRRVGKTFLIRNCCANTGTYVEFTGIQKGSLTRQLNAFAEKMTSTFFNNIPLATPNSWQEAFQILNQEIEKKKGKFVLFFDEVPWLATKRSNFIQELENSWNTCWSKNKNIKVILCGSAASWMLDNIVNAKGGLHNRLSHSILLKPFTLKIAKQYLESRGGKLNQKQFAELYMVTGGIPYYLNHYQKGKSLAQNIQTMCFKVDAPLYDEFERLFKSLFDKAEIHLAIIRAIAKQPNGISRDALLTKLKMTTGGTFNKRLQELESAGFIRSYTPLGRKQRDTFYRVIDEYCIFYLNWIEPEKISGHEVTEGFWSCQHKSSSWQSWAGYAFESLCMKHIEEIRHALGLEHTGCRTASWRHLSKKLEKSDGAQIDMLFDRDDNAITLFEIKFSESVYVLDKAHAQGLIKKMDVFEKQTKTKKQIFWVLISAQGIKPNVWSEDLISATVTLDDFY